MPINFRWSSVAIDRIKSDEGQTSPLPSHSWQKKHLSKGKKIHQLYSMKSWLVKIRIAIETFKYPLIYNSLLQSLYNCWFYIWMRRAAVTAANRGILESTLRLLKSLPPRATQQMRMPEGFFHWRFSWDMLGWWKPHHNISQRHVLSCGCKEPHWPTEQNHMVNHDMI